MFYKVNITADKKKLASTELAILSQFKEYDKDHVRPRCDKKLIYC